MAKTVTTSDPTTKVRVAAAVAAIEATKAFDDEVRVGVGHTAMRALLPEIAEAHAALAEARPELTMRLSNMADGTGFAEVVNDDTWGVLLSSERFFPRDDLTLRYEALAAVAQAVLAGEVPGEHPADYGRDAENYDDFR